MVKGTERSFSSSSVITETTNTHLRGVLERLEARRGELLGLGTDYTSGLHDDPAVVREMQQLDGNIDKIKLILNNCEVLPSRTDTSQIEVGNRVKIKFEEDRSEEIYRLGTATDASFMSDEFRWISTESLLGKELNGKKKGDSVLYTLGVQQMKVKVVDVLSEKSS